MRHKWLLVLACGWVLLQPPPKLPAWTRLKIWLGREAAPTAFSHSGFDPDLGAPLSKWQYLRSYDTAKECENERARDVDFTRERAESMEKEFAYASSTRCLPASLQLR